jgi:hypothetical protein
MPSDPNIYSQLPRIAQAWSTDIKHGMLVTDLGHATSATPCWVGGVTDATLMNRR